MIKKTVTIGCIVGGLLNVGLQAAPYGLKMYSADSHRPCIAGAKCEIDNPHWNDKITKVTVTYLDDLRQTHEWTKMINSSEGITDCDRAAAYFPYRFERCPEE